MITKKEALSYIARYSEMGCLCGDKAVELVNKIYEDEKEIDGNVKYLNERFTQKEMGRVAEMCMGTGIGIDTVAQYVRYRNEIKKPIKTTRPLKALIKKLIDAQSKGYEINQVLEIMYDNEWQSFELDWIDKKLPKKSTQNLLSEFGFTPDVPTPQKKIDYSNLTEAETFEIYDGMNKVNCNTQIEYEKAKRNGRDVTFNLGGDDEN